jgi:hypothetical protein
MEQFMAEDLKAIREAWEKRDARGQRSSSGKASLEDDDKVRKLADKYVAAHKADFAGFEHLSLDALVKTLEGYRESGDEEGEWKIQTWLFHHFEPQNIGGTYEAQLRVG